MYIFILFIRGSVICVVFPAIRKPNLLVLPVVFSIFDFSGRAMSVLTNLW